MSIVAELKTRYGALIRSTAREDVYAGPNAGYIVHAPGADVLSDSEEAALAAGKDSKEPEIRAGVARPDGR